MARQKLDWIVQAVREGRLSNGAALRFAQQAIAESAASPQPDDEGEDFSSLWPPASSAEADRRRRVEAAARNARHLTDDELIDALFPPRGEA